MNEERKRAVEKCITEEFMGVPARRSGSSQEGPLGVNSLLRPFGRIQICCLLKISEALSSCS